MMVKRKQNKSRGPARKVAALTPEQRATFLYLLNRLSPENLAMDGGITKAQIAARKNAIKKEWRARERSMGIRVQPRDLQVDPPAAELAGQDAAPGIGVPAPVDSMPGSFGGPVIGTATVAAKAKVMKPSPWLRKVLVAELVKRTGSVPFTVVESDDVIQAVRDHLTPLQAETTRRLFGYLSTETDGQWSNVAAIRGSLENDKVFDTVWAAFQKADTAA